MELKAYDSYVAYCKILRQRPLSFKDWQYISRKSVSNIKLRENGVDARFS